MPAIGVDPAPSPGQDSAALDDNSYLTLLAGRAPAGPDEITVGAQTLRAIRGRIGETVRVAVNLATGVAPVATQATVQVAFVLLAIPATLVLANLIAIWPGWRAARLRPAVVLRTE